MERSPRTRRERTIADLGELGLLRLVRKWMATDSQAVRLGIGDDAAVLAPQRGGLVVTTDALIEGVHFRFGWTGPEDLGHKAMVANLSDLAAMAARPLAAFLALGVPPTARARDLQAFYRGIRAEADVWDCPLAGGDLTRADCWTIAITVIGRAPEQSGTPSVFRRDTARPGDFLYVTGWPGRSGAGLDVLRSGARRAPAELAQAHRRPVPRLREAERLARLGIVTAAMDVSDGIWDDAAKLAEASGVDFEIYDWNLPVHPALERWGRRTQRDPRAWVLMGGEDYELLFTTSRRIRSDEWPGDGRKVVPLHLIGEARRSFSNRRRVRLIDAAGRRLLPPGSPWSHFD